MGLGKQMSQLMTFVTEKLTKGMNHWETCLLTADQYDCWETADDGEHFPLWLSFVVAGQMREMGIEN